MNDLFQKIGLIIPIHNGLHFTQNCLHSLDKIFKSDNRLQKSIIIIVVDDGSTDGSKEWINEHYPGIIVLEGDGNLWWSGAINLGAKYSFDILKTEYVLLWNNDIISHQVFFQRLLYLLSQDDKNTIYGAKIKIAEDESLVWSMGGVFNPYSGKYDMIGYYAKESKEFQKVTECDWLPGMGTIIPKAVIDNIGYWNAEDFPQYHGDSDFTYRAKLNGFKIKVIPDLIVYNHVTKSGLDHGGTLKGLLHMMTDIRSKTNFRKNLKFYRLYAKSPLAFIHLFVIVIKVFGGFIKWKILAIFGLKKKSIKLS